MTLQNLEYVCGEIETGCDYVSSVDCPHDPLCLLRPEIRVGLDHTIVYDVPN